MTLRDIYEYRFSAPVSMYDFDLAIWDPARSIDSYSSFHNYDYRTYQGRRWLTEDASAAVKRDVERRRHEIVEFLRLGRTLVVFVPSDIVVSIETGEKEYSGTGRNQKVQTILADFDLLDEVLPIELRRRFATGLDMTPVDGGIGPMYRETSQYWVYRSAIESDHPLHPLLQVTGTTQIVGAELDYEGGRVILLPQLRTEDDDEDEDDAEEQPVDFDTPGALADKAVLQWLIERITTEEVEWPAWIDDYRFQSEVDRAPIIERLRTQAAAIQMELDQLVAQSDSDKKRKLLAAGTGTPFEIAVAEALTLLGFDLQPVSPGRTDIRGTWEGRPVVVETKGVGKSAAESHSAQLEKWVAEEVVEERAPKGILVINAWQKLPPLERTQAAFPPQMRPYAQKRDHCLVTGLQLLNLAMTALRAPDRRNELATLLLDTTGVVEGWDDLAEIFSQMPTNSKRAVGRRRKAGNG